METRKGELKHAQHMGAVAAVGAVGLQLFTRRLAALLARARHHRRARLPWRLGGLLCAGGGAPRRYLERRAEVIARSEGGKAGPTACQWLGGGAASSAGLTADRRAPSSAECWRREACACMCGVRWDGCPCGEEVAEEDANSEGAVGVAKQYRCQPTSERTAAHGEGTRAAADGRPGYGQGHG